MTELKYYPNIYNLLLGIEAISALVGLYYYPKLKHTYWKWFSIYLIFICFHELFWKFQTSFSDNARRASFTFLSIPIQHLFFYWLYAYKSLKNKLLFYIFSFAYIASYIPLSIFFTDTENSFQIILITGNIPLIILLLLELKKQIKNDDILKFRENKMFYINIAMIIFYVSISPFYAFYEELKQDPYKNIWNIYYLYFYVANCIMYLLFITSFICGKHQSP